MQLLNGALNTTLKATPTVRNQYWAQRLDYMGGAPSPNHDFSEAHTPTHVVVRGYFATANVAPLQGSGFRAQGSGCRGQGSGFRVQGSGSRVQGSVVVRGYFATSTVAQPSLFLSRRAGILLTCR